MRPCWRAMPGEGRAPTPHRPGPGGGGGREVPQANAVVLLLEDLLVVRMEKVRRNIHQLSPSMLALWLGNEVVIDVTNV